eukprot:Skav227675  [mRNA]  locus=scaffold3994:79227:83775:+ [translate_table: standard]
MATARCLLCGAGDAKGGLPRCGWCEQEAASLNPEEAELLSFCGSAKLVNLPTHGLSASGEKIPNHLLEPLPDPVTLGDNQSCNDPAKQHKREAPKDSDVPGHELVGCEDAAVAGKRGRKLCPVMFELRASPQCHVGPASTCTEESLETLGSVSHGLELLSSQSLTLRKLDRASDDQERRQYKAILVCLQRGPRELQENGEQAKS